MKKERTYTDAMGREVPASYVPKFAKAKDAAARKILAAWKKEEARLKALWKETVAAVEKIHAEARKEEKLEPAAVADKGYFSFRTFDGKVVVRLDRAREVSYNEKIDLAKELIDEAVEEIAGDTAGDLRTIVESAFKPRGKNRTLDRQRLGDICKMNVRNAKWQKAVELIKAAAEESGRMDYVRVLEGERSIVLDIHACARAERDAAAAKRMQRAEGGAE